MSDKQPEAPWLADALDRYGPLPEHLRDAAAELRRLHALCDEMGEALGSLLEDTQHKEHTVCGGECPVLNARTIYAKWKESK